jgi:hypothetical protein
MVCLLEVAFAPVHVTRLRPLARLAISRHILTKNITTCAFFEAVLDLHILPSVFHLQVSFFDAVQMHDCVIQVDALFT